MNCKFWYKVWFTGELYVFKQTLLRPIQNCSWNEVTCMEVSSDRFYLSLTNKHFPFKLYHIKSENRHVTACKIPSWVKFQPNFWQMNSLCQEMDVKIRWVTFPLCDFTLDFPQSTQTCVWMNFLYLWRSTHSLLLFLSYLSDVSCGPINTRFIINTLYNASVTCVVCTVVRFWGQTPKQMWNLIAWLVEVVDMNRISNQTAW